MDINFFKWKNCYKIGRSLQNDAFSTEVRRTEKLQIISMKIEIVKITYLPSFLYLLFQNNNNNNNNNINNNNDNNNNNVYLQSRCSYKFGKVNRKTPVAETLFLRTPFL